MSLAGAKVRLGDAKMKFALQSPTTRCFAAGLLSVPKQSGRQQPPPPAGRLRGSQPPVSAPKLKTDSVSLLEEEASSRTGLCSVENNVFLPRKRVP